MKDDSGPAFPELREQGQWNETLKQYVPHYVSVPGMTLRQYAAIKLRVPESGLHWLDEMILKAKRDELAGMAMQALVVRLATFEANLAYEIADATLKEREK